MDRHDLPRNRGRSFARGNGRGRGWRGRDEGRVRPSTQPPPSTAAVVTASDAPPIVGTCPDMCPATERAQRERLRDLAVFERAGSDPKRTSPSLAVKKFCRTISSTSVQASDIRPLPVLRETMDYLLHLLNSTDYSFEVVHDFIFDRTRSVRQDISIQNLVNDQAIHIYEDVIKFHILSHQRLARSCQDSDASSLCYLNTEQLMKCLLSLFDMYHTVRKNNSHSNREAEYHSFFVLLHLGCKIPKMADSLSLWYSQLPASVVRSKEMIFARTILRCYHLGNFKRFFCMIAAEASDLQLCLVEPFLNEPPVPPSSSRSPPSSSRSPPLRFARRRRRTVASPSPPPPLAGAPRSSPYPRIAALPSTFTRRAPCALPSIFPRRSSRPKRLGLWVQSGHESGVGEAESGGCEASRSGSRAPPTGSLGSLEAPPTGSLGSLEEAVEEEKRLGLLSLGLPVGRP